MARIERIAFDRLPIRLREHLGIKRRQFLTEARRLAAFGAKKAAEFAEDADLVAFGDYVAAFRSRSTGDGAVIFNDVPYAATIEFGRRPGLPPPPLDAIRAWVNIKFNIFGKDAYPVARAVQRAIARRGLPPKRILHQATQWALFQLRKHYANALRRTP